ncbi:MAG TPA: ribosomal protein S18-alanine N-acetyltransferase [Chloroflexota bacterium]|nr:ribosomal protein S18-alanine N-acetyltransferase [Chloroflexota bacterium]
MPYRLERMQIRDIPAVVDIERASFSMTWPANSYKRELEQNRMARYVVVRYEPGPGEKPIPPELKEHKRPFPFSLLPRPFDRTVDDEQQTVVVGYGGLWLMVDEAHVTSVAVHPSFRGRGLGELLMFCLLEIAVQCGARWVTLEVRVSNTTAQALYKKLGFREAGIRPRYYTDNNEDAVIMWSEELHDPSFRERYGRLKQALRQRLEWTITM